MNFCDYCGGRGLVDVYAYRGGSGESVSSTTCDHCGGTGMEPARACARCPHDDHDHEYDPDYVHDERAAEPVPAMRLAGGKPEQPGPDDDWWQDRIKLGELLVWLFDEGELDPDDASNVRYFFEKPWKWEPERRRMLAQEAA